jgi:hypothetical protein
VLLHTATYTMNNKKAGAKVSHFSLSCSLLSLFESANSCLESCSFDNLIPYRYASLFYMIV